MLFRKVFTSPKVFPSSCQYGIDCLFGGIYPDTKFLSTFTIIGLPIDDKPTSHDNDETRCNSN